MALCENILLHLSFWKICKIFTLFDDATATRTQSEDDEAYRAAGGLSILFYCIKFALVFFLRIFSFPRAHKIISGKMKNLICFVFI